MEKGLETEAGTVARVGQAEQEATRVEQRAALEGSECSHPAESSVDSRFFIISRNGVGSVGFRNEMVSGVDCIGLPERSGLRGLPERSGLRGLPERSGLRRLPEHSGLRGLTERSGLWSGLCGLTERSGL